MRIEIFDDDIEQLRDDLSVEPWNVISNDDVRNSCLLPIRISYEFVDMGDTEYGFNQNFSENNDNTYDKTSGQIAEMGLSSKVCKFFFTPLSVA